MNIPSKRNSRLAYHAIRISLGLVYLFFGMLKFFDGVSPAEFLAGETIHLLSFSILPANVALKILAVGETSIGLLFLTNRLPRTAFFLFLAHMAGTFTPFIVLPDLAINGTTLAPTLIGQYILKNVVYVVAVSAVFVPVLFEKTEKPARLNQSFNYLFPDKGDSKACPVEVGIVNSSVSKQISAEA